MSNLKKNLPKLYPASREIKRTWYVEYTAKDGLRKKIYGRLNHLPTVADRLKEADNIINSIIGQDLPQTVHSPANQLIKDLTEVFELKQPNWSSKTHSAYQTHFTVFCRWYRANGCPVMDMRQAMRFLNTISEKNNATTRNNYRNNLKMLWRLLGKVFKNRYPDNPFTDAGTIPESQKTKEWYRPAQVDELKEDISQNDPQLWLASKIMFHCFVRPNELRQLRLADIIPETKRLQISSIIAKTKRTRHIPIPDSLYIELMRFADLPRDYFLFGDNGRPGEQITSRDNLSKRHKAILQRLAYPAGYTFYSWKNTGAVKMLCQDKRNIRYISKCMGHHSLDMTDRYFQSLGVDEMAETINFPNV